MAEWAVPIIGYGAFGGGTDTSSTWHSDGSAATYATLPVNATYQFGMSENPDLTEAINDVVGWRLEVEVLSGSGYLGYALNFDSLEAGGGYFSFNSDIDAGTALTISGPGTHSIILDTYPSYVGTTKPYEGLWSVVENLTYPPYNSDPTFADRNYGNLSWKFPSAGSVQLAEFRIVFTDGTVGPPPDPTVTHAPPLRLHPRSDGLGFSSTRRVWPTTASVQRSLRQGPGAFL